ncbi:MAG: PIN domain-containing protein [Acidobacteria bacterium]|nr:PIN domain-containing protein [Acidobacteriota bacterium]
MIYVDTSVLLSQLLDEQRQPPESLWTEELVTSRLTEYELWVRLNARGLVRSHGEAARELVARLAFTELSPTVLARALEPFPVPVRTLDALHLASLEFLCARRQPVRLATYHERQLQAARRLGFDTYAV